MTSFVGVESFLGTRLHVNKRWLLLVGRAIWAAVAMLSVALFVAGIISEFGRLRSLCPTDACTIGLGTTEGRSELERLNLSPVSLASFIRALHGLGLTVGTYTAYTIALQALLALVYATVAALIFWRKSHERVAWFASLALLTFGTATYADVMFVTALEHPALWIPVEFLRCLGSAAFVVFLLLFPDGRFVPRWTKWVALLWVVLQIPEYFFPSSPLAWSQWPAWLDVATWMPLFAVIIFAQVYSFRHVATSVQQRQTKWVIHGVTVALVVYLSLGVGGSLVTPAATAEFSRSALIALLMILMLDTLALLLIPASIAIAILRHHLFDIDLIISQTLVYGSLMGILAIVYQTTVVALQTLFLIFTGQGTFIANVLSTVIIGALFEPLRRRLRTFFDQHVYPRTGLQTVR